MSAPGPGETRCPFCAETIKAAAVKCRYCRSDLPESGPSEPVPGAPVLDVVTTPLAPAAAPAAADRSFRPGPVPVLLAVLCLVLAVGTVWIALDDSDEVVTRPVAVAATSPDQVLVPGTTGPGVPVADPVVAAVRQAATTNAAAVLSYGYRTLAQDRAAARAVMAPDFLAEYDTVMAKTAPTVRKNRFTQRATAEATSLVSLDADRAVALLFVNSVITSKDSPGRQTDRSRVLMTMTRQDGRWIVSQIDALLIN